TTRTATRGRTGSTTAPLSPTLSRYLPAAAAALRPTRPSTTTTFRPASTCPTAARPPTASGSSATRVAAAPPVAALATLTRTAPTGVTIRPLRPRRSASAPLPLSALPAPAAPFHTPQRLPLRPPLLHRRTSSITRVPGIRSS